MANPANTAPTGGLTPHITIRDRRAKDAIDFYAMARPKSCAFPPTTASG